MMCFVHDAKFNGQQYEAGEEACLCSDYIIHSSLLLPF